ncbi:MAG: glycerol kinase [Moraxellaceae bacterium]|nr:MAG: glycerol kinase [Moraxellaceae bacterium]
MSHYLMVIDQGTTSTRAVLFDERAQVVKFSQREFKQYYPSNGWVEHDAEEIWSTTLDVCREVLQRTGIEANQIAAMGITNQRETTVIWDRDTGKPIANAIVWQDRRTAEQCSILREAGNEPAIKDKTGLLLDPYFSASKIQWLLDRVPGARQQAEAGQLAFGTIDCYLLWKLTEGKSHYTDATNASRTMLFNIHQQCWDKALLKLFDVPLQMLPEVKDCCADFGQIAKQWLGGEIPITGIAGDQQAALIGQACFEPGMAKSTYGTGCFVILNTGPKVVKSDNRLLSTVAYRLAGEVSYGVEGSIFNAGTTIQWLRDGLKAIDNAAESETIANQFQSSQGVYLVPAFTGLGAPYWDPDARAAILGLTRDSLAEHIVVAGLQSVAYQTRDLLEALRRDGAAELTSLRVDGGMVVNRWLCQFLADQLQVPVVRPKVVETTALGAAYLAGLQVGVFDSIEDLKLLWQQEHLFEPSLEKQEIDALYSGWLQAVDRVRN